MTNNKDKPKKLKDRFNYKRKDYSNYKDKINVGKLYNNTMKN